ncbi:MAG: M67 family metallopeptidase [Nitrososphaerota archaeon]|nr:M67 family metallopeptidase [Nitrososphaerota archaeon]
MTIRIAKKAFDEMRAHAEATYPEECCGLLVADGKKEILESVKMRNVFSGPRHDRYDIDPLELFRADRSVAARGLRIAAIYHSHPDYPATLSRFDLDHSFTWYSYVVTSVPKGRAGDTRAWLPSDDHRAAVEEEIQVVVG